MGSNPGAVYWMDLTFFTFICCKNCNVCLKRTKINKKEAGVGPFFKKTVCFKKIKSNPIFKTAPLGNLLLKNTQTNEN